MAVCFPKLPYSRSEACEPAFFLVANNPAVGACSALISLPGLGPGLSGGVLVDAHNLGSEANQADTKQMDEDIVISGHINGWIVVWDRIIHRSVWCTWLAHSSGVGGVVSLHLMPELAYWSSGSHQQILVSQGRDAAIRFWRLSDILLHGPGPSYAIGQRLNRPPRQGESARVKAV
ncbi:unnamed protein product [Protopolystoma xenopodis]|uniref:Uncharacterized protein n=1 Tax=Protopolystoma xenopodis TaxID=117903 RepID=A0A3S5AK94_9PLAT|nr:unnamed protein product [Protopolystoma xenopodis]